jgi:[ribosomal protein S18]-alanine N-acetyltransferase
VRLRPAISADIPAMIELEQESATSAHWSREQYENLFAIGDHELVENFILVVEDPVDAIFGTATAPVDQMIAYLAVRQIDRDWELQNIVVSEKYRRHGIGTSLLTQFIAHARAKNGSRIFLEVRESNQSARALYSKLGFQATGMRRTYYANPVEDAIVYHLGIG